MKLYDVTSADYIKCKFIDYLSEQPILCIGNEIMYGINKMVADLVFLMKGKTYAVEIKAQNDNLLKIQDQLSNYRLVFDYVLVVTTENHIKRLMSIVDDSIVVFVIKKDNSITLIQRGRIQKLVDKQSILATLSAQFISFKLGCKLSEVDNVKCQTIRRGKDFIKKLLFQFFEERLLKQYNVFLNEKGVQTHIEDLGALSHYNYIE